MRDDHGVWKIAQYNLSVPIPNERFKEVKALIEARRRLDRLAPQDFVTSRPIERAGGARHVRAALVEEAPRAVGPLSGVSDPDAGAHADARASVARGDEDAPPLDEIDRVVRRVIWSARVKAPGPCGATRGHRMRNVRTRSTGSWINGEAARSRCHSASPEQHQRPRPAGTHQQPVRAGMRMLSSAISAAAYRHRASKHSGPVQLAHRLGRSAANQLERQGENRRGRAGC